MEGTCENLNHHSHQHDAHHHHYQQQHKQPHQGTAEAFDIEELHFI